MLFTAKKMLGTAQQLGCEVLVQVKGNQKDSLEHCQQIAQHYPSASTQTNSDKGHGWIEQRTTTIFIPLYQWLPEVWRELIKTGIVVKRQVSKSQAGDQSRITTHETCFYISTTILSADAFGQAIRRHWSIENQPHYVRDVTLKEDVCQVYTCPDILARMRSLALNIHFSLPRFG